MSDNRNEVEKFGVTPEQLKAVFARSTADAKAEREARQRAAAWPDQVEQMLVAMATHIGSLETRLSSFEAGRG